MEAGIQGKIVFVTGGASGIGKGIVTAFCQAGADVIFCDMNEAGGKRLCEELESYRCTFVKADVSNESELTTTVNDIIKRKGNIDIIVNNAGVGNFGSILDVSVEDFDKVLRINLRPVFITAKLLAKHRADNPYLNSYGRIVNIASTRYLMSEPNSEAYAASKGGIVSLTHALALSLSKYNITVNCISPGWIETGDYDQLRPIDHKQHPSGRVGVPQDIAQTCLFLCNPANNFINGQNIVVDGGMTKKMIYEE
ncbi:MAG: SDR family oxidoreductase [Prevotella sp.]|jgi:NAD(P)-dependent dehydrogenase (short-subunit alcohol dehydrogenase family)|nr:SDR family oxidoreductase [Prevotella sp.]